MKGLRLLVRASFTIAWPFAAGAQAAVQITTGPNGGAVQNRLPFPVAILLRAPTDSVRSTYESVRVAANGELSSRVSRYAVIDRFEPMVPIGLRAAPSCEQSQGSGLSDAIAVLQAEMNAPGLEGSADAQRQVDLAFQLAKLRERQVVDSWKLERNSAVARYNREKLAKYMTPEMRARQRQADRKQTQADIATALTVTMNTYADVAAERHEVLRKDAKRYQELVSHGESALASVRLNVEAMSRMVEAHSRFVDEVVASLDNASASILSLPTSALASRLCAEAADVEDAVKVTLGADVAAVMLTGRLRFNSGSHQAVLLRNVRGTRDWHSAFHWPVDASTAELEVRPLGSSRWMPVGHLSADRPSLTSLETRLEKEIENARKQVREATFRAKGGDEIKTIIIP